MVITSLATPGRRWQGPGVAAKESNDMLQRLAEKAGVVGENGVEKVLENAVKVTGAEGCFVIVWDNMGLIWCYMGVFIVIFGYPRMDGFW